MKPELSIVIPAYNEAAHIEEVISELADVLAKSGLTHEIVIVNNGSTDGTAEAIDRLEKKYPTVRHIAFEKNQTYDGGVLAGLAVTQGNVLGWTHADGQIDPNDLLRMYRGMKEKGMELGKAVRIERRVSRWRKVQSVVWYTIFKIFFPSPYRDPNGPPRLLTRHAYEVLKLEPNIWFLEPQFVIKAVRLHMPIYEIETIWRNRRSGQTKAHLFTGLHFLGNLIQYRLGIK